MNAGNLTMTGFGSNTGVGVSALKANTTGFDNTATGTEALRGNTMGIANTATGEDALRANTTGFNNTAVGVNALDKNTTGNDNTAVGFEAGVSAVGLTNATAIGTNAVVDASNKIRLGDDSVTVVETKGDFETLSGSFIAGGTTLLVPDYVFEKDYPLMSLKEPEAYISREKHLPNVPGIKAIRKEGLNLSEFQMTLLEKVEELTLHTLEQEEKLEAQQQQIAQLQAWLAEQTTRDRSSWWSRPATGSKSIAS